MKETSTLSRLWDLVTAYRDRQPFTISERQLAAKLGYASSSSFDNWREPKNLPDAQALVRFAALTGTPYQRVLDAALEDVGYLPEPAVTDDPIRRLRTTRNEGLDYNDRQRVLASVEQEHRPDRALHPVQSDLEDVEDFLAAEDDDDLRARRRARGVDPETGESLEPGLDYEAARDVGREGSAGKARRKQDQAGEPPLDDVDDMEPR